jgi:tricorn protease
METPRSRAVGLLGIDWALDQGAYRIRSILRGAPWDHEVRSPLDQPSLKVKEGDYILSVNREPIDITSDPWSAFEGLEKQTVMLTVNEKPSPEGAREILVETLSAADETKLRQLAWIEANRRRVEEASSGRIGYIYMPDTSSAGQNNLMRQFKAQSHLAGLIIDERFNGGGQLADRFLELLNRPAYANLAWRYGKDRQWPPVAHFGPQAMLINGWAGSGGDALPWFFRTAGRGPLIGTRTWGGLIGPAVGHQLIDGGGVVVPPGRLFGPEGKWFAEGHGVEPDIQVPEDFTALARGKDAQLERAIQEVEERIRQKGDGLRTARPGYEKR